MIGSPGQSGYVAVHNSYRDVLPGACHHQDVVALTMSMSSGAGMVSTKQPKLVQCIYSFCCSYKLAELQKRPWND